MKSNPYRNWALILGAALAGSACEDSTGPLEHSGANLSIAFSAPGPVAGAVNSLHSMAPLQIQGSNGLLSIETLHVVVAEFELKRLEHTDCAEADDPCEEFEAGPFFLEVPLDGAATVAVSSLVEPDTYDELDFEIEDIDDEEEESPAAKAAVDAVRSEIRAQFPDWPKDASVLVTGTFTPEGGTPLAFRVYFDAEVEIEMPLVPPVTVTAGESGGRFTVVLDPARWFLRPDGTVRDLTVVDFDQTGQVPEFEFEVEDGFTGVEFDD